MLHVRCDAVVRMMRVESQGCVWDEMGVDLTSNADGAENLEASRLSIDPEEFKRHMHESEEEDESEEAEAGPHLSAPRTSQNGAHREWSEAGGAGEGNGSQGERVEGGGEQSAGGGGGRGRN
eukprot:1659860-Rhodomonas_salina.2